MSDIGWYIKQGNDEIGPISETDLRHRLINGFIPANTLVRGPKAQDWTSADKVFPDICLPQTTTDKDLQKGKDVSQWRPSSLVWYYLFNGEKRGPVSRDVLVGLLEAGNIPLKTFIMRDGMDGWVRADAVLKNLKVIPPDPTTKDLLDAGVEVISDVFLWEMMGLVFDVILDSVLDIFSP